MKQVTSLKYLNAALWFAQILLAASLIWSSYLKLGQPVEVISAMWPWTGQVSAVFLKFTGVIDLCAAVGLILPSALRIQPSLTPAAAVGFIALMLCASIFHIIRGEASEIGANIVFALIAAFIAWGRFRKVRITQK